MVSLDRSSAIKSFDTKVQTLLWSTYRRPVFHTKYLELIRYEVFPACNIRGNIHVAELDMIDKKTSSYLVMMYTSHAMLIAQYQLKFFSG